MPACQHGVRVEAQLFGAARIILHGQRGAGRRAEERESALVWEDRASAELSTAGRKSPSAVP
jgi:hypothetical protein